MLKITNIKAGSPVFKIGVSIGDELISINGHAINEIIDYRFYQAEHRVALKLARNGKVFFRYLTKDIDSALGLDFEPDRIIRCRNNCVFCFVHNNPKGLRQTLYIKDDDYRQSFMYGNFVTLTNVSDYEIRRIIKLRLSPIYISVQATDEPVRRLLFGRRRLPPILSVLKELAESNIYFHSQVVIVPGYNDGSILDRTAADLAALRPVCSISGGCAGWFDQFPEI
jgi:putative radical SAM enzyme (TIGR03279 family)